MSDTKKLNIDELIPDDRNANRGNEEGQQLIERSFKTYGAGRSVLLDKDGRLIAGNKSHDAAKKAGIKKVRVIETTGDELIAVKRTDISLDSKEGREMAIADNATAKANIEFDFVVLDELEEEHGIEMESWGIVAEEEEETQGQAQDDEYEMPDEIKTDIVPGDLFEFRKGELCHRLLCGDSTDSDAVARLMDGEKADLVFTDPPYGIAKEGIANDNLKGVQFYQFSSDYISIAPVKENSAIVCYHSTRTFYHTLNAFIDNGWKFEKMLFFYRPDKMPVHTWNGWMMTSQAIMLFSKGTPNYLKVTPAHQDVYRVTSSDLTDKQVKHPTVKPIQNCIDLMIHFDAKLIYEPFLGSGTTMVAAHQLNRNCYGMELDEKYCQVIVDRMTQLDPEIEVFRNGELYINNG